MPSNVPKMPQVGEVWRSHEGYFEAAICNVLPHGSGNRYAIVYNMNGKINWRELEEFRETFRPPQLTHDEIQAEARWLLDYAEEVEDEGGFGPRLRKFLNQLSRGEFV